MYLTRKIPGRITLGIIQPHFQELSQETQEGCLVLHAFHTNGAAIAESI